MHGNISNLYAFQTFSKKPTHSDINNYSSLYFVELILFIIDSKLRILICIWTEILRKREYIQMAFQSIEFHSNDSGNKSICFLEKKNSSGFPAITTLRLTRSNGSDFHKSVMHQLASILLSTIKCLRLTGPLIGKNAGRYLLIGQAENH